MEFYKELYRTLRDEVIEELNNSGCAPTEEEINAKVIEKVVHGFASAVD